MQQDDEAASMLIRMTDRGTITIPKEIRERVPKAGLLEVLVRDDGVIELRPQITVDASQAWFWTERWQRMEREADEAIAAGRVEQFDDVESFLADLDAHAAEHAAAQLGRDADE
jgi:bifunctional DNA-binding transcriptional regulator/antitoxin component of YhaV-PrlF toxin-antitoxin module